MQLKKLRRVAFDPNPASRTIATIIGKSGHLYIGAELSRKIENWDYVSIYYACTSDGLVIMLKKTDGIDMDAFKIIKSKNCGYYISIRALLNKLGMIEKLRAKRYELRGDELWLFFPKR